MATNEEIVNSRIIGYIEPLGNNARVTVIGYKNPDGEYVVLEASKAPCPPTPTIIIFVILSDILFILL